MKSISFVTGIIVSSFIFLVAGCTTGTSVMPAAGGTYTVSRNGQSGFTSLGTLRKEAYDEINKFAAEKGLTAEVISVNEVPMGIGRFPQVDVRFRLVKASDRLASQSAPNLVTTKSSASDAMGRMSDSSTAVVLKPNVDFYEELKKLGELKEKGLLSEAEFNREKERLLNARDK